MYHPDSGICLINGILKGFTNCSYPQHTTSDVYEITVLESRSGMENHDIFHFSGRIKP